MKTLTNEAHVTITRNDLLAAGFTATEVDALEALRPLCPFIEFFDSRKEIERLRFMKWTIAQKSSIPSEPSSISCHRDAVGHAA